MCGEEKVGEEVNYRIFYREGFKEIKRRLSIILATPIYSSEEDIIKAISKLEGLRSERIKSVKPIINDFSKNRGIYGENERFLAQLQKERELLFVLDPSILSKFVSKGHSEEIRLVDLRSIPQVQKVLQFYGLG